MQKIVKNLFHIKEDVQKIVVDINKNNSNDYTYVNALSNIVEVIFDKESLMVGNYYEYLLDSDIDFIKLIFSSECLSLKEQNDYIKTFDIIDEENRHDLISKSMWMVAIIALNYINNGIEYMDLVQEGSLGIINAINNYKNKNNKAYSTLVRDEIISSIEKYICSKGKYGSISDNTFKYCRGIQRVNDILINIHGCEVPLEQVADYLGISSEKFNKLYMLSQDSLDVDEIDDEVVINDLSSYVLNPGDIADDKVYYEDLLDICKSVLNEKEIYVLFNNLGLNGNKRLSYNELANIMGCSKEYIRYTLNCSLSKIRREIDIRDSKAYNKRNHLLTIDDIKKIHKK